MSVYVFRNATSESARELAMALGGNKIRHNDRIGFYRKVGEERRRIQLNNRDVVVCWGEMLEPRNGCRVLNGAAIRNKYDDAVRLRQAGVPTVEVSLTQPRVAPAPPPIDPAQAVWDTVQEEAREFTEIGFNRHPILIDGIAGMIRHMTELQAALRQPAPQPLPAQPDVTWLPRLRNHVGGNDLLTPPTRAEFWVKKLDLVREFRVHSFFGRSIRAGLKREREGFPTPHPWIRSHDAGWAIIYDGVSSRQAHRNLAHQACEALGLQFGAIDIGEQADGSLVVLEANRAPGLENGTVTRYAGAITRWMHGELEEAR